MRRVFVVAFFFVLLLVPAPSRALNATAEGPITLEEAISFALKKSPVVESGRWDVVSKREGVKAAWGKHLPQVDLESGYTRFSDPLAVVPIKGFGRRPPFFSKNIYQWKAVGYLPVYQGGRISRMVEISRLEEEIGADQLKLTKEELVADVTNLFNRVLQLNHLLKAQEDALGALQKVREDTHNLLKVGRVAQVDLMRIDTQVSVQKQELIATRELLRRTKETLAYLLGWPPRAELNPVGELREVPFDAKPAVDAVERRPDVRAALKRVEEAQKRIEYEFGAHLPDLYLSTSYGDRSGAGFHGKEEVWQAGAYLRLNIFSGGTISAKVRQAKAELFKARSQLQNARLKAEEEILHASSAVAEARAKVEAARLALQSAKESFRVERLKYASGAGTVTDMLLAQAQWLDSKARYYQALYDENSAVVAYKLATSSILEDGGEELK